MFVLELLRNERPFGKHPCTADNAIHCTLKFLFFVMSCCMHACAEFLTTLDC